MSQRPMISRAVLRGEGQMQKVGVSLFRQAADRLLFQWAHEKASPGSEHSCSDTELNELLAECTQETHPGHRKKWGQKLFQLLEQPTRSLTKARQDSDEGLLFELHCQEEESWSRLPSFREESDVPKELKRAVSLGLLERGKEPKTGAPMYFVSPLLDTPLQEQDIIDPYIDTGWHPQPARRRQKTCLSTRRIRSL